MKLLYRVLADLIFAIHGVLFFFILFGFLFPVWWSLYMSGLVLVLISDLIFGYCILSKWEFYFRRQVNPEVNYEFDWTSYYLHKLTERYIDKTFYYRAAVTFLVLCITINLYFKFLG
jgi:hypothetical protein